LITIRAADAGRSWAVTGEGDEVMEIPTFRPKRDRRAQPRIPPHDTARTTPEDGDFVVREEKREGTLLQDFRVVAAFEDVLRRLRAEFLEVPGLRLKPEQVRRLCGVERTICQLALDSLVDAKFLCVNSDGIYGRSIS
jgi:hypothetical protein